MAGSEDCHGTKSLPTELSSHGNGHFHVEGPCGRIAGKMHGPWARTRQDGNGQAPNIQNVIAPTDSHEETIGSVGDGALWKRRKEEGRTWRSRFERAS